MSNYYKDANLSQKLSEEVLSVLHRDEDNNNNKEEEEDDREVENKLDSF